MKPTIKILAISTALSAGWLMLPGAAAANGCPSNTVWNGYNCVAPPGGGDGGNTATGGNSSSTATGGNATGVGVGVGTGIGHGGAGGAGGQGGAGGSATSTATGGNATGGRGGNSSVRGSGNSSSRSNVSGSGNSTNRNVNGGNSVNIRNQAAAATAYAPALGGYGLPNCVGDTNPSGSFSAGFQGILFGASAGSMKASNFCAILAVGGERAAIAYLAAMDPNAHRALVAAGLAVTPSQARQHAAQPVRQVVRCPETHPVYVEGKGCRK